MSNLGTEPIGDDEILLRRVPETRQWYYETSGLSPHAFEPRKDDDTGLSVVREKHCPIEVAATGPSRQGYFVARLRAGDLRKRGIEVCPRPIPDILGHAEITSLTFQDRDSDRSQEIMVQLATELCLDVHGPFHAS